MIHCFVTSSLVFGTFVSSLLY